MKALVTGATGFIGGALCRGLVAQGWQVRVFRRENSLLTLLNELPVEHFVGDLTRPETILPALEGVDAIFHAAAMMNAGSDLTRARLVTVDGTRNVLQAAISRQVKRYVHVSSVAALGVPASVPAGANPILMDETHSWNEQPEHWTYGYAKYLAEMEVQKAVARGLDAVIVNPSIVLGAGDIYRQSSSIVQSVSKGNLRVSVDGGLNLIHIEDIVSGVLAAWRQGKTGQRYILSNLNVTISGYLKLIAKVTGAQPPQFVLPLGFVRGVHGVYGLANHLFSLPVDPELLYQAGKYFYYSNLKAKQDLGWEPVHTIESAVQEAYEWFQHPLSAPYLKEPFEEGKQSSL